VYVRGKNKKPTTNYFSDRNGVLARSLARDVKVFGTKLIKEEKKN